jgi:dephospho-CoA kinase
MPLIALTGGIASGKSTIANRLADQGAIVVDADRTVRELQEPGLPVFERIVETFGEGVVASDGSLDRAALGTVVFRDAKKLAALNAIVHVVVYDVPLLKEARGTGEWDMVVVAHAPAETRIRRMVENRGMTPEDADARVRSQASDDERLALADVVIDTGGSIEHTLEQTDRLWRDLSGR